MRSTVITVLYRTPEVSLTWVPEDTPVICVHNDEETTTLEGPGSITHLRGGGNVGFGAAVNRAAAEADTERIILTNPDVELESLHFQLLDEAEPNEVVTVPLSDRSGKATSVVNRYPTPLVLFLTGIKVGRILPRGNRLRSASRHLGGWFAEHDDHKASAFTSGSGKNYWASGAVLSLDRKRFLAVGGFHSDYFLYFEDIDLQQRLARRFPDTVLRQAGPAGRHAVSGSTDSSNSLQVDIHHCQAAITFANHQDRLAYTLVGALLSLRLRWLKIQVGGRR